MPARPSPIIVESRKREIAKRYGRKRKRGTPRQIIPLRLKDFATLFRSRYGITLPDDDAGRDDIQPVLHHLAKLPDAGHRCALWIEQWAPWMTVAEQRQTISDAVATCRAWSADQLAWRYRLTAEQRTILGITTIGAIDQTKAQRLKARKVRARKRAAAWRAAKRAAKAAYTP
jgi:hypothetical protein